MQYHLDTIPVWEALEKETPCLFCALHEKLEAAETERCLGGSVMEPDERIKVNHAGLCQRHHLQLFEMQNRLGHALITDSHVKEQLKKLEKLKVQTSRLARKSFLGKGEDQQAFLRALRDLSEGCVICQSINGHMERYLYTFIHLWKTDETFSKLWSASSGACLPHASLLMDRAAKQLSGSQLRDFADELLSLVSSRLAQDEKDLEWFTLKYDYRNQDKPWGNSRNALERAINRLRGKCL